MVKPGLTLLLTGLLLACSAMPQQSETVYQQVGGLSGIYTITDRFISRIEQEPRILKFFKGSDVARFRTHFAQHLCVETGGPCEYQGESMQVVHQGMNISESDFNLTVELLINAMQDAGVPYTTRNKILAELAPMRASMLYR
ncbi:group I truncated hemoglobin [Salinimonas lutimaris]|uniref:group I truncated hemoglobin n=1 Tax=Salinimonas lutimaris TaxID=914153 RepID=UPI0010BFB2AC|nr:group 1 truncated hemoglobin [Salinimonas lutimaris]